MATKEPINKLDSQSSDRIAVDYAFKTNVKFFRNADRTQKRVLLPFTQNQHIVVKLIEGTKLITSVKIWRACDPSVTVGYWHMFQYEPEPMEAAQLFQAAVLALQEASSALGQFMDYYGLRSESQQQVIFTPLATSDISYYRAEEDQSEQPECGTELSEALALAEDARQAKGQYTEMRARWTFGEQNALRLCRQALKELTFNQQIGEARTLTTEEVAKFIEQWTATIEKRATARYALGHYQVELEAPDLYDRHQSFITIDVEHRQTGIEVQGVQYENEYPATVRSYPGVFLPLGDTLRVILLDAAAAYARFASRVHYNVRIPGPFDLTSSYQSSIPEVQLKRIRGEQ